MRLINIDIFPLLPNKLDGDESEYERGYHDATDNLNVLPLVDAVPVVRGEWIHGCTDGAGTEFCYCSACGEDALKDKGGYTEFSRYCPNCGAKMEDRPCG